MPHPVSKARQEIELKMQGLPIRGSVEHLTLLTLADGFVSDNFWF